MVSRVELNRQIHPLLTNVSLQDVLNRPADEFGNDEQVENLWAMKAFEDYEVYFNVSGLLLFHVVEPSGLTK